MICTYHCLSSRQLLPLFKSHPPHLPFAHSFHNSGQYDKQIKERQADRIPESSRVFGQLRRSVSKELFALLLFLFMLPCNINKLWMQFPQCLKTMKILYVILFQSCLSSLTRDGCLIFINYNCFWLFTLHYYRHRNRSELFFIL